MARASCIYMVTDGNMRPEALFTVKHEMFSWLDRAELMPTGTRRIAWRVPIDYTTNACLWNARSKISRDID